MIRTLAQLVARTLVELALVLLLTAGLALFLAYRILRRAVTPGEDRLERFARQIGGAGRLLVATAKAHETADVDEMRAE